MNEQLRYGIAKLSGAALGFIVGDVPGAFIGYNAAGKLTQFSDNLLGKKKMMTPAPSARKRRRASVSSAASLRRRRSISSAGSSRRSISVRFSSNGRTRTRRTKRKGRVGKSKFKKRPVKVSKSLRDKIKKVVTDQKPEGYFQETIPGNVKFSTSNDNQQFIFYASNTGFSTDALFSPSRVMDAASVLWNEKAQVSAGKTITDVDNFSNNKLEVKLLSSAYIMEWKNNTQRTLKIQIVETQPKSNQVQGDPIGVWSAAMAFQITNNGPNQSAAALTHLHTHPTLLPDFNRLFSTKTTTYYIAPGAQLHHTIVGPKDKLYKFQSFWNGSTFQPNMVGSVWPLVIVTPDLLSATTTGVTPTTIPGRFYEHSADEADKHGLIVEMTTRMKLEMPEMAGLVGPTVTAPRATELNLRQFSYAFKYYQPTQTGTPGTTTLNNILFENPISSVDPLP